jgi:hypothetical protein
VNINSLNPHLVEVLVTYDFTLHFRARDQHSFGSVLGQPLDTFL